MAPAAAQRFVIDRADRGVGSRATAHRAADLDGFEAFVILDAAADIENDFAQGDAQRNFDQTGVLDIAGQGEGLGAFAFSVPMLANHSAPFRMIWGTLA